MRKNLGRKLLLIVAISIFSLYISLPSQIPYTNINKRFLGNLKLHLGLDLIGGSHLVFDANTKDLSEEERIKALDSLKQVIERRVNFYGVSEPNIQISRSEAGDRVIVELPGVTETQDAIDLVGTTAQLNFATISEQEEIQVLQPTDLTGADLSSADVVFDQVSGDPAVAIEFTPEGADKFEKLTENNVGKPLPILLDNQIVSAPVVQDKITGGQAQISGDFTLDEAKDLAIQLNAGALPVSINLVSEKSIGASLGTESVQKSVQAGLIGVGLVFLFMILFYGKLGFIANIGLIIFGLITLALYKLIPVVLTLPGVAGFLLSVGMAVDANILIFERFREEKQKGDDSLYALEISFGRAWDSIRDANIATLVTAFILANPFNWTFLHTSGPVRGFAITLSLGIGVSLFTGVFVSRNLLRYFWKK